MKLALLLLGCFVCVSKQERYIWPFPASPSQAVYKPLFYSDGLPAGYDVVRKANSQVTLAPKQLYEARSNCINLWEILTETERRCDRTKQCGSAFSTESSLC